MSLPLWLLLLTSLLLSVLRGADAVPVAIPGYPSGAARGTLTPPGSGGVLKKQPMAAKKFSSFPYFYLQEGVRKCFVEELIPRTMVTISYKCPELSPEVRVASYAAFRGQPVPLSSFDRKLGVTVSAVGPYGAVQLPKSHSVLEDPSGMISFVSSEAGEHTICFQTNTTHAFHDEKIRFHLQIDVGSNSPIDWQIGTTKSELETLHMRVEILRGRIKEMLNDQMHMVARESRFRSTTESSFTRVWVLALLQVAVGISLAAYQIASLKNFLKAKKLV